MAKETFNEGDNDMVRLGFESTPKSGFNPIHVFGKNFDGFQEALSRSGRGEDGVGAYSRIGNDVKNKKEVEAVKSMSTFYGN